jgi:hypothetical protein
VPSWTGGSASWFSTVTVNGVGWDPAIPVLSTDANALQQDITISIAGGNATVRSLSMQGGSIGLSATSAVVDLSGGSLVIATGSPVGNVTQTGGSLQFNNAFVNPDNSLDFTHAGKPGASSTIFNLVQSPGGTVLIDSGSLTLSGNNSDIAGTIGGAGTLADPIAGIVTLIVSGNATLESTAVLNVTNFNVIGTNAQLTLNSDRNFAGSYLQQGVNMALNLNGHTFTLTGTGEWRGGVRRRRHPHSKWRRNIEHRFRQFRYRHAHGRVFGHLEYCQ